MSLCLLSPVWPSYRKFAPMLREQLAAHWPGHPPLYFIGDAAWDLPGEWLTLPHDPHAGTNWSWSLREGVRQALAFGFTEAYLIAEEHVPLARCDSHVLAEGIPQQAQELGAKYVSLMGWDNRRFCSKSPRLAHKQKSWMHLTGPRDPRFHLHPAWWDLGTLERCCDLALADSTPNGSAWHFEKTCGLSTAPLPVEACYQICASAGEDGKPRLDVLAERWIYNRLMALVPLLPPALRWPFYHAIGFDNVFCQGPYPMVFSGLLAKGKLNPALLSNARHIVNQPALLEKVNASLRAT